MCDDQELRQAQEHVHRGFRKVMEFCAALDMYVCIKFGRP